MSCHQESVRLRGIEGALQSFLLRLSQAFTARRDQFGGTRPGAAVASARTMCHLIRLKTSYLLQTTGALRQTPGGGPKSRCQTRPSSN
jgi:hypothetical protein